jgi:hypothetical protein
MKRSLGFLCAGALALVALLPLAGPAAAKNPKRPPPPSLTRQRAVELVGRARQAREEGRIGASLGFYGRAYDLALADPQAGDVATDAVRDALAIADGLRFEIVSGDRQKASPTTPPQAPLQVRVRLDRGREGTKAIGVPVFTRWSAGTGLVTGEQSSDENGLVTLRIERMSNEPRARLELGIDTSRLPILQGVQHPEHAALVKDALAALEERKVSFEFVDAETEAKSRIYVLIEEKVFDQLDEESIVGDRLTTTLVDRGARVFGITDIGRDNYQKIGIAIDRNEWVALAPTLRKAVDYVMYGRVSVRFDYVNQGGGIWCVARGRIGLYSVTRPEILASVDFSNVAGFAGDTRQNAAEEALRKCAAMAVEKLVPLALRATDERAGTR